MDRDQLLVLKVAMAIFNCNKDGTKWDDPYANPAVKDKCMTHAQIAYDIMKPARNISNWKVLKPELEVLAAKGYTLGQLATRFGCSKPAVGSACKRLNITLLRSDKFTNNKIKTKRQAKVISSDNR